MKLEIVFKDVYSGNKTRILADEQQNMVSVDGVQKKCDAEKFIFSVFLITKDWEETYANDDVFDGGSFYLKLEGENEVLKKVVCHNSYPKNFGVLAKYLDGALK